ncbi:MAG: FtsQ-type POTRA domain-containing protein [Pseudomonadales bacterium]|nr:FtsQ-type POTRA domain-containing protein [Pseudomonadales bacterium]
MSKKQKKSSQGASRLTSAKKKFEMQLPELDISFSFLNIRTLISVVALAILVSGIYASFIAVETVMDVAVENVKINGQLRYQSEDEVGEIIHQFTSAGFVNVNLSDLHTQLKALPWVYKVLIKRQLPDDLIVTLTEEQVAAVWNDESFINIYGEIFTPKEPVEIPGLVRFSGLDHKELLALYKRIKILLPEKQLPITALVMDERKVVKVGLHAGSELIINADDVDAQLMRWNKIVDGAMSHQQLNDIKQADLRYNNGAAVAWKTDVASRKMR